MPGEMPHRLVLSDLVDGEGKESKELESLSLTSSVASGHGGEALAEQVKHFDHRTEVGDTGAKDSRLSLHSQKEWQQIHVYPLDQRSVHAKRGV